MTVAFGRHLPPDRLAGFVAGHRDVHAARLEAYEALAAGGAAGLDAYALATIDFGIRYERAVLDWFDHLPGEISS